MKTRFLTLIVLSLGFLIYGQGRRASQSAIHAAYGFMPLKGEKKGSFMAIGGYDKVIGEKGFLGKVDAFYQDSKVGYLGNQYLPYEKYGINISAGYSYEKLLPVLLNAYVGVFGAYEKINNGLDRDPLYNAIIEEKIKGFNYGISGSAEVEIIVLTNLSIIANYTQFYDFKSDFYKSNFALFGGLKYYIN